MRTSPTEEEKVAISSALDKRTILRTEVGSTAHGVTHSSNDIDEMAIYIPTPRETVWFSSTGYARPEHFLYRPGRGPNAPSGPGDLDRTYFTLNRVIRLIANGNPSILFGLFGVLRHTTEWGDLLLEHRGRFINQRTQMAYLGYIESQQDRMTGERGAAGRIRRSPEGGGAIDWKYAMHMVRLGFQCLEYLTTGSISSPSVELDLLLDIRNGRKELGLVLEISRINVEKIKALDLPENGPSDEEWADFISSIYWDAWHEWGDRG